MTIRYETFKNQYIAKSDVITMILLMIRSICALVIWIILMVYLFKYNDLFADPKQSHHDISIALVIMFAWFTMIVITTTLMKKVSRHSYYSLLLLMRYRNQKKNTITNLLLKAIHNASDEIIVDRYKELDKTPLLNHEKPRLTQEEEMKLVSALLNMGEIDTAQRLAKIYVRSNRKVVQNKVALSKVGKSKKVLKAKQN